MTSSQDELRILEDRKRRVKDIVIDRTARQVEKLFGAGAPLQMAEVKEALFLRQKEDRAKVIKEALSHLTPEDVTLAIDTLFPPPPPEAQGVTLSPPSFEVPLKRGPKKK